MHPILHDIAEQVAFRAAIVVIPTTIGFLLCQTQDGALFGLRLLSSLLPSQ